MGQDFNNPLSGEGARSIPVFGDIAKMFGAESREEREVREAYENMKKELQAYRPAATSAAMGGLSNQLGVFGPVNELLGKMYGPSAMFDMEAMNQNPFNRLATNGRTSTSAGREAEPGRGNQHFGNTAPGRPSQRELNPDSRRFR
jgi:hypothetical protein